MDPKRRQDVLRRLSRVEGQIRGLARMVGEDKYCVDIMIQVAAAKSALNKVGLIVMEGHAHGCLVEAIKHEKSEEAVDELMDVISKYVK
ncbi:MAG: metal-sensitive transcriptional regulator [Bacteroidota bacterium]